MTHRPKTTTSRAAGSPLPASRGRVPREQSPGGSDFTVELPIRTVSELNAHDRLRVRFRRKKSQQQTVALVLYSAFQRRRPALPVHVVMTRIGPQRMDSDNVQGALKHVRDEIARWLNIDDGDEAKATWQVEQQIGPLHAVRVRMETRKDGAQ